MNKNRLKISLFGVLMYILVTIPAFGMDSDPVVKLEADLANLRQQITSGLSYQQTVQLFQEFQRAIHNVRQQLNGPERVNSAPQPTLSFKVPQPIVTSTRSFKCSRPRCPFEASKEDDIIFHDYSVHQ
jgi:hypothetical protein